jgi:pimeloyl-ACP methyl ester carboxylesterase
MDLNQLEAHRTTVRTDAGPISCIDMGEGPATAVFVHGIATNAALWRNVLEDLSITRRCVALDLPLHGKTPPRKDQDWSLQGLARVLGDLLDGLGVEQVDLVANDTGGAVAQVFAAHSPGRLRSLVLTNCDTHDNLPPEAFKPIVEMAERGELAPLALELMGDLVAARATAFGAGYEDPENPPDDVVRSFLEPAFGTIEAGRTFERLLGSLQAKDLLDAEPKLRELLVPTLVAWGTDDSFFELKWAHWLAETIPGTTKIVEIEGGRLFFPDERGPELVPHIREHWDAHHAS